MPFNNQIQQLFIPLLPLLFWFLCFSTIDPSKGYQSSIAPSFITFKAEPAKQTQAPIDATAPTVNSTNIQSSIVENRPVWHNEVIRSGDTLGGIFERNQLSAKQLHAVLNSGKAAQVLKQIRPNQKLDILINDNHTLQELRYHINNTSTLKITAADNGFKATIEQITPDKVIGFAEGVIKNSFYVAAQKAGLNSLQIMELVKVFNSKIDFAREIHPGDKFRVLFNEEFVKGKKLRNGDVVAAEFTSGGKSYKVIRYTDPKGNTDYYTPDGNSTSLAFTRRPVLNARISSGFNLHRMHPILHILMPHYGTDFAAPMGTPIKATGDGRVAFVGVKNGYGNVVILQHGQRYSSLYGHMSRFAKNLKVGTKVKIGQVIGYVGHTGRASGPHVHYEFRINGNRYDPMKVPLPHADAVAKIYKKDFLAKLAKFSSLLESHKNTNNAKA